MDLFRDPLLRSKCVQRRDRHLCFCSSCMETADADSPIWRDDGAGQRNLIDRMKNGISVIDNPAVRIPQRLSNHGGICRPR